MRLGKIERHILVWAHRRHRVTERGDIYYSKSGALLSYARERYPGLALPKTCWNIKSRIPRETYTRLHVSFTKALKSLQEKELVVYVPNAHRLTRKRRGPYLETLTTLRGKPGARRSLFYLTKEGDRIGRQLWIRRQKLSHLL